MMLTRITANYTNELMLKPKSDFLSCLIQKVDKVIAFLLCEKF